MDADDEEGKTTTRCCVTTGEGSSITILLDDVKSSVSAKYAVVSEGASSVIALVFGVANYNRLGKDAINIPRSHDRVSITTSGR